MSIICTSPMCVDGKASVDTMDRTYNVLIGNPRFNRSHFEPIVTALDESFDEQYSFYSSYIPFNPACCAIKDIGAQADKVTNDMLESVGAATAGPGPGTMAGGFNLDAILPLAYLAVGAMVLSNITPFIRLKARG